MIHIERHSPDQTTRTTYNFEQRGQKLVLKSFQVYEYSEERKCYVFSGAWGARRGLYDPPQTLPRPTELPTDVVADAVACALMEIHIDDVEGSKLYRNNEILTLLRGG
jgi:hypothetical protein